MSDAQKGQQGESGAAEGVNTVAVLLVVFAILLFFYLIHFVLLPFVVAGVSALVLTPVVDWAARRTRAPRTAVALTLFFVLAGLVGFAGYKIVPALVEEAMGVIGHLQSIIQRLLQDLLGKGRVDVFGNSLSASGLAATIENSAKKFLERNGSVVLLLEAAFGGLFGFFLALTLFAYFLVGGASLVRGFMGLFPPSWRPALARILGRLHPILFRYFAGIAVVVVYASCAAYLGLGIFLKLQHAGLLAGLTGLLEILPVIGPWMSGIIAGFAAVEQAKSAWSIVAYIIYAVALRLSIDELMAPLVLSRAGRVHPTLIIFCFLAGGLLYGIPGVILAIPAALTVKVVLATVYEAPNS
jgi:predicted PurR-regulated permease PerM